jgi:hypothetical protein
VLNYTILSLQFYLQPTIGSILAYMQNRWVLLRFPRGCRLTNMCSLSAIIVCRFHLDLQMRNAHPNTIISQGVATRSLGSFHAATQRIHDAVMTECSDSPSGVPIETEPLPAVAPTNYDEPVVMTDDGIISLVEFLSQPLSSDTVVEV